MNQQLTSQSTRTLKNAPVFEALGVNMPLLNGRCSCGSVAFKFFSNTVFAYQCHCSICRKATGSAFSTTVMASEADFEWTCGQEKITTYTKESGYKVSFCSQCGSPVPNRFRGLPLYTVPAGSLEDSDSLKIEVHLHLGSKATWDLKPEAGHQFNEIPSLRTVLELLHAECEP